MNQATEDGDTPLMVAASHNQPHMIELLLLAGANPDAKNKQGHIALEMAQYKKHPACVAALQPRTILCLRRWCHANREAFPLPFRRAINVLIRQVSFQCPPAIDKPVWEGGRMAGVAVCPVKDPKTGKKRDVDLLQEFILDGGMLDCDWCVHLWCLNTGFYFSTHSN